MAKHVSSVNPRSLRSAVVAAPANLSLATWLSGLLAVVALIGSAAGFFIQDLFKQDNAALAGCARGTALVILVVAVPALVIAMILSARGSLRARMVWLGMLLYILYNSIYFSFSATFNSYFLVFVAMLSLSGWALLALLSGLDGQAIQAAFGLKTPVRIVAISLLFPVLIFVMMDLRESLIATVSNTLPPGILNTQLPTNHFHVVDLAFLTPLFLLAAVWLWQRRAWGYALAGMMLVYYTIELLGIASDQWFGGLADPTSPLASQGATPAFAVMAAIFMAITVFFLRNLSSEKP